jgi:hypothetical protein
LVLSAQPLFDTPLRGFAFIARPNKSKQRDIGERPLSDAAKLFEAREGLLGQWRVERVDGRSEAKRSSSPNALRRALRYAIHKYHAITHGHRRSR